ncbi:hypothetical protein MMC20_005110 [Loxospora ochrophaea]|nr:hypothetical protein [Loxospora ochrophaea]
MLNSIISFTPEMAGQVTEYCMASSNPTSSNMKEVWDWTVKKFENADKMSSPLQGSTMKFTAEFLAPKRILEIGAFSGYSALAWYESTEATKAEIITLELDKDMIAATRYTLDKYNLNDRVKMMEGYASESIDKLSGEFDLVFVDANKDGYEGYCKQILDKKMLSPKGLIMCDNIFARGMTISTESNPHLDDKVRAYWTECGKALDKFNKWAVSDPRIDVLLMPVYDGVTYIKWKN